MIISTFNFVFVMMFALFIGLMLLITFLFKNKSQKTKDNFMKTLEVNLVGTLNFIKISYFKSYIYSLIIFTKK